MKLIHRHIFSSVAATSLGGVSLFVFILLSANALRDIAGLFAGGQIDSTLFLRLIALLIPYSISFALPLGLLVGTLLVVGRMSARQEITAMKAAGLSLWQISSPVLLIAVLGAGFSVTINNFYAPVARTAYKDILRDLVREDPLRFIVAKTFIRDFPGYVLHVGEKEANTLRQLWIWELGPEGQPLRLLRADEGTFSFLPERDALLLTLRRGFAEMRSESNPDDLQELRPVLSFEDTTIRLSLERILGERQKVANDVREVKLFNESLPQLLFWLRDVREKAAAAVSAGNPAEIKLWNDQETRVRYVIQRNFAMGCSILALVLLGIPLSIKAGRAETHANLALALLLSFAYYALLVVVDGLAERPDLRPDLLIWVPNLLLQSLGLALLWKTANR